MWWLAGCMRVTLVPAEWPAAPATDTGGPTDPTRPGETGAGDCPAEAGLLAFEAAPGRLANQVALTVETEGDVPVAVRCAQVGDPGEVHFREDEGGRRHAFRLSGLLPSATYACEAAPACVGGASAPIAVETGAAPGDLARVVAEVEPALGVTGEWTLFNLKGGGACGAGGWLQVVDALGRPRFWHPVGELGVDVEARYHGRGRIVYGGGRTADGRPRELDLWDGVVWDAAEGLPGAENVLFHHDGKMLADGRILTLEIDRHVTAGVGIEGFRVRVYDRDRDEVAWEYRSATAAENGELPLGYGGDVWHANWADVVVEDGRDVLYLSLCNLGWILRVDPATQRIDWVLGAGGDFALVDHAGRPLGDDQHTQCQHGLEVVGDRVLVYDNGWWRGQSRAAELELDPRAGVARLLWTWEDGWYEGTLGDVDALPGGRVLVTKAHPSCWEGGGPSEIVEVDPLSGVAAHRLRFLDGDAAIYRAERIGACDLFDHVACPEVAARVAETAAWFGGAP